MKKKTVAGDYGQGENLANDMTAGVANGQGKSVTEKTVSGDIERTTSGVAEKTSGVAEHKSAVVADSLTSGVAKGDELAGAGGQFASGGSSLKSKKAWLIVCIVTFVLSAVLYAVNIVFWLDALTNGSSQQLDLAIYVITLGLMTYLPGVALSLISLVLAFVALKTQVPKERRLGKVFAVLAGVLLALYAVFTLFLIFLRQA